MIPLSFDTAISLSAVSTSTDQVFLIKKHQSLSFAADSNYTSVGDTIVVRSDELLLYV